jgi:hypothetical protein
MNNDKTTINSISAASAATAQLPVMKPVQLPDGQVLHVKRLSWLQFEAVWAELAGMLGAVASTPENAAPEQFAQALSGVPGLMLKLCTLCTEMNDAGLAALPYDAVLAIAAEAIALNFLDSAGVRRFFAVACQLPKVIGG